MSVLQLQVDVDSDVQPELHAILASISTGGSQAERLRQLAATGLIWEHLRLNLQPSLAPAASMPGCDRLEPTSLMPMEHSSESGGAVALAGGAQRPVGDLPILHDAVESSVVERSARLAPRKDATVASAGAERRVRPRPRLLRMREKGLFNNGPDC
jgi:hypothetical protein